MSSLKFPGRFLTGNAFYQIHGKRFRIMQRDNFKCCMCGASPAKDPSVVLHIDHIVPWAKGGETTFENLQTLCSKCNLGKSDLLLDENN